MHRRPPRCRRRQWATKTSSHPAAREFANQLQKKNYARSVNNSFVTFVCPRNIRTFFYNKCEEISELFIILLRAYRNRNLTFQFYLSNWFQSDIFIPIISPYLFIYYTLLISATKQWCSYNCNLVLKGAGTFTGTWDLPMSQSTSSGLVHFASVWFVRNHWKKSTLYI